MLVVVAVWLACVVHDDICVPVCPYLGDVFMYVCCSSDYCMQYFILVFLVLFLGSQPVYSPYTRPMHAQPSFPLVQPGQSDWHCIFFSIMFRCHLFLACVVDFAPNIDRRNVKRNNRHVRTRAKGRRAPCFPEELFPQGALDFLVIKRSVATTPTTTTEKCHGVHLVNTQ